MIDQGEGGTEGQLVHLQVWVELCYLQVFQSRSPTSPPSRLLSPTCIFQHSASEISEGLRINRLKSIVLTKLYVSKTPFTTRNIKLLSKTKIPNPEKFLRTKIDVLHE